LAPGARNPGRPPAARLPRPNVGAGCTKPGSGCLPRPPRARRAPAEPERWRRVYETGFGRPPRVCRASAAPERWRRVHETRFGRPPRACRAPAAPERWRRVHETRAGAIRAGGDTRSSPESFTPRQEPGSAWLGGRSRAGPGPESFTPRQEPEFGVAGRTRSDEVVWVQGPNSSLRAKNRARRGWAPPSSIGWSRSGHAGVGRATPESVGPRRAWRLRQSSSGRKM
jgi:hypothetical protein